MYLLSVRVEVIAFGRTDVHIRAVRMFKEAIMGERLWAADKEIRT